MKKVSIDEVVEIINKELSIQERIFNYIENDESITKTQRYYKTIKYQGRIEELKYLRSYFKYIIGDGDNVRSNSLD